MREREIGEEGSAAVCSGGRQWQWRWSSARVSIRSSVQAGPGSALFSIQFRLMVRFNKTSAGHTRSRVRGNVSQQLSWVSFWTLVKPGQTWSTVVKQSRVRANIRQQPLWLFRFSLNKSTTANWSARVTREIRVTSVFRPPISSTRHTWIIGRLSKIVGVDDAWNLVGCLDTHLKELYSYGVILLFMLLYFVSKPCN
ncbi:hypothetical protein HanHA300_Chr13g0474341 [Helianthus annuus]|nr:hypothetical protein HanHA300_Chr13g0474341 [Helianthus annuus]